MTTELAVPDYTTALEQAADPATYVLEACERAKSWLAHALEHGGIDQIVELKSQAEAIRVYTMSKQLGMDAQLSAAEIVRRAERGLGIAIRRGQASGEIARKYENGGPKGNYVRNGREVVVPDRVRDVEPISPAGFFHGNDDMTKTYVVTDGVTDEQYDAVISEAKAEGNMSRANVIRKVRAKKDAREARDAAMASDEVDATDTDGAGWIPPKGDSSPRAAARRRELIQEFGPKGYSSKQIADRIGIRDDTVREIARKEGIALPADEAMGRGTRKNIDSNRIVRETVHALDGLAMGAQLVDFDDLDQAEIVNWTASLNASLRILNRLNRQLKEIAQ